MTMRVLLLTSLLVLLVVSGITECARCGRNEVYKKCVSSTCAERTCGRRHLPQICSRDCARGCFCGDRYYRRRRDRRCVPWSLC